MDILKSYDTQAFTNIIAAVGTGTMLAGLIRGAAPHQHVTGISVLKNNFPVHNAISKLAGKPKTAFQVLHNFHFGGYAKHTPELLRFMNDWYAETNIPTDFVYTAKTFFAAEELIQTGFFPPGSSLLLIHSGGLQGNRSLPAGTLCF
jgi:1-aminocyclopropane-1-carboxylate deaminase